jgi:hypothetical protein
MADTANDYTSSRRPKPGSLAAEDARVGPVPMPLVDRAATAVTPIVLIIGKYFGWTRRLLVWQDLRRTAGP